MSDVHIKGLKELNARLQQLPVKLEKNVLRGALRAGAKVIWQEAMANVPVKAGVLRAGLIYNVARGTPGTVVARVSVTGAHAYIARWVEYGTAAHFIKVNKEARPVRMTRRGPRSWSMRTINRSVAKGSLVIGGHFVGESVAHPGAQPRPFMRPALDSQATAAVVAAAEYIKKRLATKHGIDTADISIEAEQ
jgi:HK97 gp10 family phage protein